jgi:hypothetical protein
VIRPACRAWAAVAAALLAAGAAPTRASDLLALRAQPATLLLGKDRTAALELELGAPGATPVFAASAGKVVDVRPVGPGRFAATYLPPAEGYPQVALVAAVAGGRAGWVALPLIGRGVAVARSTPGVAIRVTIGDASFGPVVAGPSGEARIAVIAPPGVRYALQGDQPLDLAVPETVHVHLAAEAPEVAADAEREVRVWAFAVLPGGAPRGGAPVEVATSHGWIGPLEEVAPGTFTGTWRLPPGRSEPVSATARLRDEPGASPPLELRRPAGPAARIALESGRPRAVAGEPDGVPVRVRVEDAAGNPVEAQPWLQASRGTLSTPARTGPGTWEAGYAAPQDVGAGGTGEIVARVGAVEARLAIETVSAEAARLVVEPAVASVVADGDAQVALRVRLLDRFGNPVADRAAPAVATVLAASVAAEPAGPGAWLVRYRPARARADAVEQVAVRAGGFSETARLDVLAPERRLSLGGKAGLAASAAGTRAAYLGAEAAWRLPVFAGRPAVVLEFGTFGHERTDPVVVGDAVVQVEGASRWTTLVGGLRWGQPLSTRWAAWVGAGAGLAHVAAEVHAGSAPPTAGSAVVPAFRGAVAAGLRIGHGSPFLEVGWTRFGSPELDALRGRLSIVTLSVGYRHDAS